MPTKQEKQEVQSNNQLIASICVCDDNRQKVKRKHTQREGRVRGTSRLRPTSVQQCPKTRRDGEQEQRKGLLGLAEGVGHGVAPRESSL